MRNILALLLALAIACLCGISGARAQITFRSASGAALQPAAPTFVNSTQATMGALGATVQIAYKAASFATTTTSTLAINMPAGTVEGDVMVAVIAVSPATGGSAVGGISAPAGWTQLENQFVNEAPGTRMTVFWKAAVAGESGPYGFDPSSGTPSDMAGGILALSGVDTGSPVVSESSSANTIQNNTGSAPGRAAPGFTNTMLLAYYAYASSGAWPTPAGMTEAFDIASRAPGINGITLSGNYQAWPANAATGARVATAAGSGDNEGAIAYSALLRPQAILTIAAPASLAAEDVMIASVSVRGTAAKNVQAPAGWALVRRTNGATDAHGTSTSLFVYHKVASVSDPGSSYTFGLSGASNGVGGIAAYRDVDTGNPIDAENGVAATSTGGSETMTGPSVSTTVANTRLVTAFAISNARTWSGATGGLTERVDVRHPTTANNTGVSLAMHDVADAGTGAAGPFSANSSNQNDTGAAHLLALRPSCGVTISKPSLPSAVATGDVMIASISVRDATTVTAAPSGWTLVTGAPIHNNTAGNTMSLFVYYKVVADAAAEPAAYQWRFNACEFVAGGIQAFAGVNTTTPIDAAAGQPTADSVTHTAPSIATTVGNTMLVEIFAFRSSATWTRGSVAMTEDYDTGVPPPQAQVGLAIAAYHEAGPAGAAATGTRFATASNDSDTGTTFMLALRPLVAAVTPARFNAYDAPVAGINGVIRTKVSGINISLAIVAVNVAGTAIETTFNGDVSVEVVDSSGGGGVDSSNCNPAWPVIATSPASWAVTLASGSGTVNTVNVANSYRNARIRVISPAGATYAAATAKGCSTDNFAIRPASFAAAVTDSNWSAAGTARALANTGATGGNVHKAGQPFTITVTPSPGTATLYDGSPTVSALTCTLPGTCASGTLAPGAFAGAGTRVSNTASYSEAGAFDLTLVDQDYASVDSGDGTPADCSANGRYLCQASAPLAVGRFVPDRFEFAGPSTPALLTFNTASCSPRSFTYIGQPFWYATLPSATLNAVNATGTVTTNYPVTGVKPAISEGYTDIAAPASAPLNSTAIGAALLTSGSGTGTYSASMSAGARLTYDRHASTLVAPFPARISLSVTASDSTENAVAGNGTITSVPLVFDGGGPGIAFDSGAQFRYGRLQIGTANGSHLVPLAVPMETQYSANGTTFTINTDDNCTTLTAANIGLGNYAGNLNAGETTPALAGAFASGRNSLILSAPGAGNNGSVDLVVNLGATLDSCTTFSPPPPAPTGANQPWLRGRWCGATQSRDTTGRATFGVYLGAEEVIFLRENF